MTKGKKRQKKEGSRWVTFVAFIPAILLVGLLAYLLSIPPAPLPTGSKTTEALLRRRRTSSSRSSPQTA
jgi:hypothetical protein